MSRHPIRLVALGAASLLLLGTLGVGATFAAAEPTEATPMTAPSAAGRCTALRLTARTSPTVANLQAYGRCEIDRRLETVTVLQSAVDASSVLSDAHESALDGILGGTADGLRALRAEIDAGTEAPAVRGDIERIFTDHRVYVLVGRQVWQVIAADTVDTTIDAFGTTSSQLDAAIDAAEAAGKDVTEARRDLAAMDAHVADAAAEIDGLAGKVLALTPAAWNAGDAKPVLEAGRRDLADARSDLREAVVSAREVLSDLR